MTGTTNVRPKSGRPRSKNVRGDHAIIRKRLKRNSRRSMRKLAADLNMNRETLRKIVVNELKCYAYKQQKVHYLDGSKKKIRLEGCRKLKARAAVHGTDLWLFTDKKIFTAEQSHNHQNDRVWTTNISEVPDAAKLVQKNQDSTSVMVWGGIHSGGKTPLIFLEKGI